MAKLNIDLKLSSLSVEVVESDEHTQLIHVEFNREFIPDNFKSKYDLFLTPHQLEVVGKFLLEEAEKITKIQEAR